MFSRWGEFAYQHRRVIPLVVVAVIILLYLTFGMRLSDRMSQEGWDDPNSDSTTAAAIEARTFGRDNNGDVILLFTAETGTIDESPEFGHIQEYLTNLLANHPDQIDHITSYFDKRVDRLISQDKRTAFAAIALKGDGDQTLKDFRAIKVQLAGAGRMFPGVSTQIAGATAVADALDEGMSQDISRAEFYALPAVALLLLVVFGSLVAACMPLIVGGLSIVGSLGVLSILAGAGASHRLWAVYGVPVSGGTQPGWRAGCAHRGQASHRHCGQDRGVFRRHGGGGPVRVVGVSTGVFEIGGVRGDQRRGIGGGPVGDHATGII